MPEGHTIHRRARDHSRWFAGPLRSSSPQGRFPDAETLDGAVLDRVDAIGKHLLYRFGPHTVHVHLGLFGKFRIHRNPAPAPRPTVRWRLANGERTLDLTGPTACELWTPTQVDALRDRLGPDPLDPRAEPQRFTAALARRRKPIGAVLLDQDVVAGVGNVYRAELLWRARLDPFLPSRQLSSAQAMGLWHDMVGLLEVGVKYDRIITVERARVDRPFSRLRRSECLNVYKRRRCPACDGAVASFELGARRLYACPTCQGIQIPEAA